MTLPAVFIMIFVSGATVEILQTEMQQNTVFLPILNFK